MSKFVILLNSDVTITSRLKAQISGARVVAVDGGIRHARALGVTPECWIGDFDSSNDELKQIWRDVPCIKHPIEKDETDGELALDYVRKHGATEVVLIGGLGGQMDHSLCHVVQMLQLTNENVSCFASSGDEEAWPLVAGDFHWDFPIGATVSLIGMTALEGLTLLGVKWPLAEKMVTFGSSLTMSNEVTAVVSGHLRGGFGVALVKDII